MMPLAIAVWHGAQIEPGAPFPFPPALHGSIAPKSPKRGLSCDGKESFLGGLKVTGLASH